MCNLLLRQGFSIMEHHIFVRNKNRLIEGSSEMVNIANKNNSEYWNYKYLNLYMTFKNTFFIKAKLFVVKCLEWHYEL